MDIFDIKGSAYLHGTNQSHYHFPRVSRHTDRTYADIRLAVFLEGLPLPFSSQNLCTSTSSL